MFKLLLILFVERCVRACDNVTPKTLSDLLPLIDIEADIIIHLEQYIKEEDKRINILKTHLKHYKSEHTKAISNIPRYLMNPINTFTLVKRLTTDFSFVKKKINQTTVFKRNRLLKYPMRKDINDALRAITLLHSTYRLNTTELADGIINSTYREDRQSYVDVVTPMSVSDCIDLGKYTFKTEDYLLSIGWYIEALNKYNENDTNLYNITDNTIITLLSNVYAKEVPPGNMSIGNDLYGMVVTSNPKSYPRIVRRYREILKEIISSKNKGDVTITKAIQTTSLKKGTSKLRPTVVTLMEAQCRGDLKPMKTMVSFQCYFTYGPHPFLRLARVKTEPLHRTPDITLYHDVISEAEIRHIQRFVKPDLTNAAILYTNTSQDDSRYVNIPEERSEVAARINRRVGHITGLNMDGAEDLQFVDYGTGDKASMSHDFKGKSKKLRMATMLFYITDVHLGGAAVFTEIDLTVFPVKRAALFWRNLRNSGEIEKDTLHGICPVLHGFYSVLTKRITNIGQELINPCGLQPPKRSTTSVRRSGKKKNKNVIKITPVLKKVGKARQVMYI